MGTDVVDLIMADHREVERLFEQLKTQPESRPLVVPVVAALLTAHSRAEEAEVYPAARTEAGETDEVAHSQEEHLQAEQIMHRLVELAPDDQRFESTLQELVDAVQHHVQEEESTVLPGMRERIPDDRRQKLGQAFAAARADHLTGKVGRLTRDEMARQAENLDMRGTSSMSKQELEKELNKQV